jgi:hypothetical protein
VTRRRVILCFTASLAAPLCADDAGDIWELLAGAASALSAGSADDFMQTFDRSMPSYDMLAANVAGLLAEYEVQSSIELLSELGAGSPQTVDLDWILQLVQQDDETNTIRRRDRVTCRVTKTGKKWKIVSLDPITFFAPPGRRG